MRKLLLSAAVLAAFLGAPAIASASTVTWDLSADIPLSDGGTLNGTFTIGPYGYLNGNYYDLTTSAGSLLPGYSYTTAINASDPNDLTVQFYGPDYTSTLNLVFADSLLVPSADNAIIGGLDGPSFECGGYSCNTGDERYVLAGFASATPLPATLPLFAGGLGFVGWLTGRRKNKKKHDSNMPLALAA